MFIFSKSTAKWISAKETTDFILCFKKEFLIKNDIKKAKLYICGLGFYDFKVNGNKIDNSYFKPNVSDYKKREDAWLTKGNKHFAYYDAYDITNYLNLSKNLLDIYVGPGYFHNNDKLDSPVVDYGKSRLKFAIEIIYTDLSEEIIISDQSTKVAISHSSSRLYLGDYFNFSNLSLIYENSVSLDEEILLKRNKLPHDFMCARFQGESILDESKHKIIDFKLNHTGGIICCIKGCKNQKIIIRYSEFKNKDGTLNFLSSSYPDFNKNDFVPPFYNCHAEKHSVFQENTYILSGNDDLIEPLFSYHCYRYIEIISEEPFTIKSLNSLFIHQKIKQIGYFSCSNPLLNQIYHCYILTQLDNIHSGIISDCPHREKQGYTGDESVIANTLLTFFGSEKLLDKVLDDIIASQEKNGYIPNAAPDLGGGGGNFWGYSIVNIPLQLYGFTGKEKYLKKAYQAIKKWILFLLSLRNEEGIILTNNRKWFLGDWLTPYVTESNNSFINTICLYMAIKNQIFITNLLNYKDELNLSKLLEETRNAIIDKFYDKEKHIFANDIQGETMLGLYAEILSKDEENNVKEHFINTYSQSNSYIDTGMILTPMLFDTFSKYNCYKQALYLLNKKDYPSFYKMLEGETTFPEHYSKKWLSYSTGDDGDVINELASDTSHCHPIFGAITSWVFKYVGGMDLSSLKDKLIIFSPKYIKEIKYSSVKYKDISFKYDYKDNLLTFDIYIPNGYNGVLSIEDETNHEYALNDLSNHVSLIKKIPIQLKSGCYRIIECKKVEKD